MRFCPQEYLVPGPCKLCQRPRTWWQPSHLVRTPSSTPPPTIKNPMVFRRPCWMQNWKMIPASLPLPKPDTPWGNWLLGNEDSAIKSFISQYPVVPKGETICPNAAAKPLFLQSFFFFFLILLLLRFDQITTLLLTVVNYWPFGHQGLWLLIRVCLSILSQTPCLVMTFYTSTPPCLYFYSFCYSTALRFPVPWNQLPIILLSISPFLHSLLSSQLDDNHSATNSYAAFTPSLPFAPQNTTPIVLCFYSLVAECC